MLKSFLGPQARKFLKKIDKETYARMVNKIRNLEETPFPQEVERIQGTKKDVKVFRVRVGDFRIKYIVDYNKNEILVFDIDKRSRVYD